MWDSNAPLQLLKSMPQRLSKEDLEKLQMVLDADKYKNSLVSGFDLCGMYAPFCRGCQKTSIYPCALAYVNMLKAGGVDIDIDAKPIAETEVAKIVPQTEIVKQANTEEMIDESAVTSEEVFEVQEEVSAIQTPDDFEQVEELNNDSQEVDFGQSEDVGVVSKEEPRSAVESLSESNEQPAKRKIRIAVARRKF